MPKKANPHGMRCIWGALGRPRADPLDVFNGFFKNSIFRFKQIEKKAQKKWPQFFRTPWGLAKNNETKTDHKTEV